MIQDVEQLQAWTAAQLNVPSLQLRPLANDASFRQYFRASLPTHSYIAMYAPPEKEDNRPFIAIAEALAKQNVRVPDIVAYQLEKGFLLLSDFGDTLYLDALSPASADALYRRAIDTLLTIQRCQKVPSWELPPFDAAFIQLELQRFTDWFLEALLKLRLSAGERQLLETHYLQLAQQLENQPQRFVHRDYHSRNLMLLNDGQVGVIDFQDAVWGPITYDLVSLLKDCYISWPDAKVDDLLAYYLANASEQHTLSGVTFTQLREWFNVTAVQRHLKVLGIFARLFLRDNKAQYVHDMPQALQYLQTELVSLPLCSNLNEFILSRVTPAFEKLYQEMRRSA